MIYDCIVIIVKYVTCQNTNDELMLMVNVCIIIIIIIKKSHDYIGVYGLNNLKTN